jgi:thiol:disulfide interchange protein DsbD
MYLVHKIGFFLLLSIILSPAKNPLLSQEYVKVTPSPSKKEFIAGENVRLNLKVSIQDGFHINANKISDPDLIPTEVSVEAGDFKLGKISYPPSKSYKFSFSETELEVYEGNVTIGVNLKSRKDMKPGKYEVSGSVHYQACNDRACFPPKDAPFSAIATIIEDTAQTEIIKQDTAKSLGGINDTSTPVTSTETKPEITRKADEPQRNEIAAYLQEKGFLITLFLIFLGGLALNLTPCVYPIIPITVSYFGAQVSNNKLQQITMAVIYVLGMSVTYSILGLAAALTGSLFGAALQNPIVVIFIAAVMVSLALSMFGLFEIRVPSALANFAGKNRQGYIGTALMGLTVGIIAAPCIGPFVLGLLVYVGQIGNPFTGFLFFFILSLGLGFPYIFLALFSSSISKLPRSGEWMEGVKVIFGLILFGLALYTLQTLIPRELFDISFPLYIILSGIYLILFDRKALSSVVYTKIKYVIAIGAIILGTTGFDLDKKNVVGNLEWQPLSSKAQIEQSIASANKPTMIDFTADWCAACKELEKYTYTDPNVIELSKKFNNIKVDLTKENKEISERYKILGLPVVAFFDRKGHEHENLRITGFVKPEEFSKLMEKALNQ